ncbi:hypothetical protein FKP32DRAFT_168448 [Trametes sanguinea]|nr:hypothetical protein FKP32DRAFT_168448 [Trametes sanguinea]
MHRPMELFMHALEFNPTSSISAHVRTKQASVRVSKLPKHCRRLALPISTNRRNHFTPLQISPRASGNKQQTSLSLQAAAPTSVTFSPSSSNLRLTTASAVRAARKIACIRPDPPLSLSYDGLNTTVEIFRTRHLRSSTCAYRIGRRKVPSVRSCPQSLPAPSVTDHG